MVQVSLTLRQRVSLARTLVRNTPIVILDDPTSAQDGFMISQLSGMLRTHKYTPTRTIPTVEQVGFPSLYPAAKQQRTRWTATLHGMRRLLPDLGHGFARECDLS